MLRFCNLLAIFANLRLPSYVIIVSNQTGIHHRRVR